MASIISKKSDTQESSRIPLSEPVIRGNEWKYIKECLDTGWVSSAGMYVNRFEELMAAYIGTKYAVAVVNGTAALHLSLIVAGVVTDDEVLVPTLTFIAPVNAVRYCGAVPIFVDCEPETLGMDICKVQSFLKNSCEHRADGFTYNKKTDRRVRAVIPVHVFGHPVDMDALSAVCEEYNIRIIEDATESLGSRYQSRQTGGLADIGCLSFNGNKIITTGGGGMIITNNKELADHARHLSTQAKKDPLRYFHDEIGYNYRLNNIQAAMGVAQLEQLDQFIVAKRHIAERYQVLLAELKAVTFIRERSWVASNYWLSTIRVPTTDRDPLMRFLLDRHIEVRPPWKPVHTLPMYESCETTVIENAVAAVVSCMNIPSNIDLTDDQITRVVATIEQYYANV